MRRPSRIVTSLVGAVFALTFFPPAADAASGGTTIAYAYDFSGLQTTYSGWGYVPFNSDYCGRAKDGWYLYTRAKWRIKDAPGQWVTVKYVNVTMDNGYRADIDQVWLMGADGGVAGYLSGGYTYPAGERTTHRITFNKAVKWLPSGEVHLRLDIHFAPHSNTVYSCRYFPFFHGLIQG